MTLWELVTKALRDQADAQASSEPLLFNYALLSKIVCKFHKQNKINKDELCM